ncbi:hypothetical protein KIN20_002825 [Parelaphostrongylus tenuis]|uniref:Uncharacterized protein n=1 Tax=Parelaphostrongylus tenuis TaxID=148309 RepID=A0AAD5QDS6_PARTN|nr:hypothetical protein KIN20_002825 [Parelaphostrongylus tenuis]
MDVSASHEHGQKVTVSDAACRCRSRSAQHSTSGTLPPLIGKVLRDTFKDVMGRRFTFAHQASTALRVLLVAK